MSNTIDEINANYLQAFQNQLDANVKYGQRNTLLSERSTLIADIASQEAARQTAIDSNDSATVVAKDKVLFEDNHQLSILDGFLAELTPDKVFTDSDAVTFFSSYNAEVHALMKMKQSELVSLLDDVLAKFQEMQTIDTGVSTFNKDVHNILSISRKNDGNLFSSYLTFQDRIEYIKNYLETE